MPKLADIQEMMKAQKTPYIRVYNMQGERQFIFENEDLDTTLQQMDQFLPYVETNGGKLIIEAATKSIYARKYTGAFKWTLEFDKKSAAPVAGPAVGVPGYGYAEMIQKEITILKMQFDHEKELRKLQDEVREKDKQDPLKIIEKLAPVAMYAMGKQPAEISQLMSVWNNPGSYGSGAIAGPPGTHTLVMKDVESLDSAAKSKRLQDGLDNLAEFVSREHMILLVEGLRNKLDPAKGGNPQFITTILSFI